MMMHVFAFLDANELGRAAAACSRWHRLALDAALWRALHSRVFGPGGAAGTAQSPRDLYVQRVAGKE